MIRTLFVALTGLLLALTVACGGSDDGTPTPTPTRDAGIALGASFPKHLTGISPKNGASLTNAELSASPSPGASQGICATFTFSGGDGMGDDPTTLVKLFVGGEDVTGSSTWVVTGSAPPTGGTICYVPTQAFEPGTVLATARWSEVSAREFINSWQFTVTG